MTRVLVLLASTLAAALLRPIIGDDGLAAVGATVIGLFCVFCVSHRLITGRWPSF